MNESSQTKTPEAYRFSRRYLNSALLVYLVAFGLLVYLSWILFQLFPGLVGSLLSLLLLGVAVLNLLVFLQQPRKVLFFEDYFLVKFIFGKQKIPYHRVERLHWRRSRNPLGGLRPRDVLGIELKDGAWIDLDHMRGKLKTIRGILERRVYGRPV